MKTITLRQGDTLFNDNTGTYYQIIKPHFSDFRVMAWECEDRSDERETILTRSELRVMLHADVINFE